MSIRIGIYGYGNLGRGVECAIKQNSDMELVGVFTRRDPASVKTVTGAKVYHVDDALGMTDKIDVMIICGGSATDLPVQTPALAKHFNVIDSFDTHAKVPEHFANVDASAKEGGKVAFRNHFRWLGSRYVLTDASLWCLCSARQQCIYFLGKGCQPGTFGCDKKD